MGEKIDRVLKLKFLRAVPLFISTFLTKGIIFIINLIVARYTSKDVYGLFVMLRGTVNLFESTISSSINPFVIKSSSSKGVNRLEVFSYFTFYVLAGSFIAIALFFIWGCFRFLNIENSIIDSLDFYSLFLLVFLILATLFNGLLTSFYIGKSYYVDIFYAVISSTLITVVVLYQYHNQMSLNLAMLILIVYHFFDLLIKAIIYFLKEKPLRFCIGASDIGHGLSNTLALLKPVLIGSAFNAAVFWFSRYHVAVSEKGLLILAEFDVTFQLFVICTILLNVIFNLVIKKLNNKYEIGEGVFSLLSYSLAKIFVFLSVFLLISFLLYDLFVSLFGDGYKGELFYEFLLLCSFYSLALGCNRVVVVLKKTKILFKVALFSSIVMLLFVLISPSSAKWLLCAFASYYFASCISYVYYFSREISSVKKNQ